MKTCIFIILAIFAIHQDCAATQDETINSAILFLQTACVNKGNSSKLEANGSIDASLKGLKSSLIQGKATYTKEEIEGLSTTLNEFSSKQASEARQCMQPYIKQILDVILKNNIIQQESLSDNDLKSIRNAIIGNKERIAKTLINNTHPSGHYNDSYTPSFSTSPDRKTLDTEITINWKGMILQHTTTFTIKTGKGGKTDLQISSDNAQIRIAAENLRTARASIESIIKNNL